MIANLGSNIIMGNLVKAIDYTSMKEAMDKEYSRRGKAVPSGFTTVPEAGNPVLYEVVQKIMVDVYDFDQSADHDWRSVFQEDDIADADKWSPVIAHLKSLMSTVVA